MKEEKYYTPEIEEFHVGFEYEAFHNKEWFFAEGADHWVKCKVNFGTDILTISYTVNHGFVRVKCLDKSDIESLGWEYKEDRGMSEANGLMFVKPQKAFAQGFYKLRFWKNTNRFSIEAVQGTLFSGTIKNKSELKKLLKQLGI